MSKCDVLLIVPMIEEFRVLCEICSVEGTKIQDAMHYHTLRFPDSNLRVVAVVLGEMGKTPASQVTEKALGRFKPKLALLLGIAGALNQGLKLGDVIIADEVDEYLASSKAVQKGTSFVFQYSGSHWKTSYVTTKYAENFEITNKNLYDMWQKDAAEFQKNLGLGDNQLLLANTMPGLKTGHFACGDTVVASEAYATRLKGINRKYEVIDMESAGFMQAAEGREKPITTMIIRGISDFADERKKDVDSAGDGVWRRYAMYNASSFLSHLLKARDFQDIVFHASASRTKGELEAQNLVRIKPGKAKTPADLHSARLDSEIRRRILEALYEKHRIDANAYIKSTQLRDNVGCSLSELKSHICYLEEKECVQVEWDTFDDERFAARIRARGIDSLRRD